jgi:hypothetical protein
MKYTLLEVVQRVLESMDSDEVNTIYGTAESTAVANIAKECYFDIVGDLGLREHESLYQLTASGDNNKPTLMTMPSSAIDLKRVEYNTGTLADPVYHDVYYKPLDEFMELTNQLTGTGTDTQTITINGSNFVFKFHNDRWPTFYTSTDDRNLLFDAFDVDEETTLTGSRTRCYGLVSPTFTMADSFTPVLDARQVQLWLQATKAQAFVELKQSENPKAEKKERRNWILARKTKDNTDSRPAIFKRVGYGRK